MEKLVVDRQNTINCIIEEMFMIPGNSRFRITPDKFNPSMHNVVKWLNIFLKSCGVNTARFLKYVWPFYNIMPEKFNFIVNRIQPYVEKTPRNILPNPIESDR